MLWNLTNAVGIIRVVRIVRNMLSDYDFGLKQQEIKCIKRVREEK
jgi:hypothetical protein